MHKPERTGTGDDNAGNQTKPGLTLQTITETMQHPAFTPEQLPELWQRITEPGGKLLNSDRQNRWHNGIGAMYKRCTTYPQHTKLTGILNGLPPDAWYVTGGGLVKAHKLLRRATTDQVLQALNYEQGHHPERRRAVSNQILACADLLQLTKQIVGQLEWDSRIAAWATWPDDDTSDHGRWRRVSETIQQELLEGDTNAWHVFLGIAESGNTIGGTAELALAIEQQNRPT